jgi:hypothetical protein
MKNFIICTPHSVLLIQLDQGEWNGWVHGREDKYVQRFG